MGSAKGTCKRFRDKQQRKTLGLNSQGWNNVTISFVRDESVGVGLPGRSCGELRRCFPKLGHWSKGGRREVSESFFMHSHLPLLPIGKTRDRLINETLKKKVPCQYPSYPPWPISSTNAMSLNWSWEELHTIESYKLVWTGSSTLPV